MTALTESAIDAAALLSAVQPPAAGAAAVFLGTVRADDVNGRRIVALDYEAYREMAEKKLGEIEAEMRRRWPIESCTMVHRLGRVPVGEASVAVAVATGHRGDAFEACRFGIDTIKSIVPIWKRDVFADGPGEWAVPPAPSAG